MVKKANLKYNEHINVIEIRFEGDLFIVRIQDVVYIETSTSRRNYLIIHSINGNYIVRSTIAHAALVLPHNVFLQPSQCSLVNRFFVTKISDDNIYINKTQIAISRRFKKNLLM